MPKKYPGFAAWLEAERVRLDLSVTEFAALLGVSISMASPYLAGKQRPGRKSLRKIVARLEADRDTVEALLDTDEANVTSADAFALSESATVTGTGASTIGAPRLDGHGTTTRLGLIRRIRTLVVELEAMELAGTDVEAAREDMDGQVEPDAQMG